MKGTRKICFVSLLALAFAMNVDAQKIKAPVGVPQMAGDLRVAKLWVSEHPAVSGSFNTYSAQPTLRKTKGASYPAFTVETVAYDAAGKAVKSCIVNFGFENADQEFIEHPKLRCDIADEKTARSVVRWRATVDAKKQIQESSEDNNTLEVAYRPNLRIEKSYFETDRLNVDLVNTCFVGSVPAVAKIVIATLAGGSPPKTLFEQQRDIAAIDGNSKGLIRFKLPPTMQERVKNKEVQLTVTLDPAGLNKEIYLGDNVESLGQNAKLPAISLKPVCGPN